MILIRHFLQIINKETGKKEEILFYFKDHQVRIVDENFVEYYDSNNYIKPKNPKEVDDDKKTEKGQTEETKEDGSKHNESV